MIIGNGMLACAFRPRFADDEDVLVFASGVSNSQETSAAAFEREHALLKKSMACGCKRTLYFSSCSVVGGRGASTPYVEHKKRMESLVLSSHSGVVIRLPQVVGRTPNPVTFANFIRDRVLSGERFSVWAQAERNLIDVDDVVAIGSVLLTEVDGGSVRAIAAPQSKKVTEVVRIFEDVLGKKANYSLESKGEPLTIAADHAHAVALRLGIDLQGDYVEKTVKKYYGPNPAIAASTNP